MSSILNGDRKNPELFKKKSSIGTSMLWGAFYIILGVIGLLGSVYAILSGVGIIPLIGTVTIGGFMGLLSIFIIMYGYGIIKKDF